MDNWILFAIASPLFYALVNILDKYVLAKRIKNVYAFSVMASVFYFMIAGAVVYFAGIPDVGMFVFPILGLGAISGLIHLLFFKVMRHAEISRLVGIMYAYPVFVALFSVLLLDEHIALYKYVGVALAAVGAILLATKKDHLKWKFTPVFGHVVFIAMMLSFIDLSDKYILRFVEPFEFYPIYLSMGAFVMFVPVVSRRVRTDIVSSLHCTPFIILIALFGFGGTINFLTAASRGPIAIVSALATLQPLFVFVFALLLSIFVPRILKETLQRDAVVHKLLGVLAIMIGVIVLVV